MGRMNGNQIMFNSNEMNTANFAAISEVLGSLEHDVCPSAAPEKTRRNRRSRKMNSPAEGSANSFLASSEHYGRMDASKRASQSRANRATSNSPSDSGSQSPGRLGAYAGAKFGDAPSPRLLPPPPQHWLSGNNLPSPILSPCHNLTSEIKTLLQVA